MPYNIQTYNGETGNWVTIAVTDGAVRVVSDRYAEKVVFESDDPEWNG